MSGEVVSDRHILHEAQWHVGVTEEFGHEPLVRLDKLERLSL